MLGFLASTAVSGEPRRDVDAPGNFAGDTKHNGVAAGALIGCALAFADAGYPWLLAGDDASASLGDVLALDAMMIVPCVVVLAMITAIATRPLLRRAMRLSPKRRIFGVIAITCGLAVLGALAVVLYPRQIDWDTVDGRLFMLPCATVVGALVGWWVPRRATWLVAAVALLGPLLGVLVGDRVAAAEYVQRDTRIGRALLRPVVAVSDRDGDGAATWLCGDGCDCDDGDATRSPGAPEVVDDGVDQDCDGEDLVAAEADAIAALFDAPAPQVARPAKARRPDILLITIDTLRADHLGVYGYPRDTSPKIDAWAKTAVVFEQARSAGPSTRFSVPPMMTGKHFTEITRSTGEWPVIQGSETLFAERFAALGYASAAFHSVRYFRPYFGLDQGFEHWSCDCLDVRGPPLYMTCSDFLTDEALGWLDARTDDDRPLLMWAYYGDPHSRYVEHPGYPSFGTAYKDLYDGEIRFVDEHVGRLIAGVQQRRGDRELIVVLNSDHGEGLDHEQDHGSLYHSANLYDELVHVPFIISAPGIEPGRVSEAVSLVDFVPTMLELVGEPVAPGLRGTSLVPWLERRANTPHPPVMFEKHRAEDDPQHGMVLWPYKVVRTPSTGAIDIYDLVADPGERRDIAVTMPADVRRRIVGALVHWHRRVRVPFEEHRRH